MKQSGGKMPLRKIIVNHEPFYISAHEGNCDEMFYLRCYSECKTSYIELRFLWNSENSIKLNPYRPVVASKIIEHAIKNGWNYKKENQVLVIHEKESIQLIQLLHLEIYS